MNALPESGLTWIEDSSLADIAENLQTQGFRVVSLGGPIRSKAEFFDQVIANLPLDPPMERRVRDVWDALSDSLENGIMDDPSSAFAIVWPNPSVLEAHDPEAYRVATEILNTAASTVADPRYIAGGEPTRLLVLMVEHVTLRDAD